MIRVDESLGKQSEGLGSTVNGGREDILFSSAFRLAVRLIHSPIQQFPGATFPVANRSRLEADRD
jgi:hypothetical protein